VATVLGAGGIAGVNMDIAKWLVISFVVLAIVAFLLWRIGSYECPNVPSTTPPRQIQEGRYLDNCRDE